MMHGPINIKLPVIYGTKSFVTAFIKPACLHPEPVKYSVRPLMLFLENLF